MFFALMMMLTTTMAASAMSYEQARNEALFLTDKMAYELNLTDAQYEAAYEINLDYLMGVSGRDDVFGIYWERRNLDLSYILFDWQWNAYIAASYFYRPLYWEAGFWHFGIYRRYPHRDYFYFGRPHFYATYRGGHAWHAHGSHGYYYGHRDHYRPAHHREHFGMHDRWNRGDFRNPSHHSSTRVTGRPSNRVGYDNRPSDRRRDNNGFNNRRPENRPNNGSMERRPENRPNSGTMERRPNAIERRPNTVERSPESRSNSGNFGGNRVGRGGVDSNHPYTNFGSSRSSSHSGNVGSSHSGSSRGSSGSFSHGSSTRSSGGSMGSRSGGGSHSSMGSHSGGGSHGGGSHSGGGHFGGRR